MKKTLLTLAVALSVGTGMAQETKVKNIMTQPNDKTLIAYYSRSGNTEELAKEIQKKIGGTLFQIEINHTYPEEYKPTTEQAKQEIADGFRPELKAKVDEISDYNVIFVGSPNWWGTITPTVSSFIEQHNLTGKTVIPFISNGGGGQQRTLDDFASQCKNCLVKEGFVTSGSVTRGMDKWLENLGFYK